MSRTKIGYFKPFAVLARLMEEVGELAREINHRFGPKKKKSSEEGKELGDEMADIIFTLACLANSQKINLDSYKPEGKRVFKKFRYVDPKILIDGKLKRLSEIKPAFKKFLEKHRKINRIGILV